jgi:Mg2+ and Co2+ transporter CorA
MPEEKDPMDAEVEGFEAPPAAPPKPGGLKARGTRPAPPPPSKPSKLKGYIMLGIIISTVVLSVAIAYKVYIRLFAKHKAAINVEVEGKAAMDLATEAQKEIFRAESKVWISGETLSAATAVMIDAKLDELRQADERIKELLDLLHAKKQEESGDWGILVENSLKVKLWILDASDLIDTMKNPEYGGLYIPMYRAMDQQTKAQKELKEIKFQLDAILGQDAGVRTKTRARIEELKQKFAALRDKLNELNDYIKKGLAREDLSPKVIKELDELRDEASKAQMGFKEAGNLKQQIPE